MHCIFPFYADTEHYLYVEINSLLFFETDQFFVSYLESSEKSRFFPERWKPTCNKEKWFNQ